MRPRRYSELAPQQELYLPGPFLTPGDNSLVAFEVGPARKADRGMPRLFSFTTTRQWRFGDDL